VYAIDDNHQPRPSAFTWKGTVPLALNGEWHELAIRDER
jgi:hypothetical protein